MFILFLNRTPSSPSSYCFICWFHVNFQFKKSSRLHNVFSFFYSLHICLQTHLPALVTLYLLTPSFCRSSSRSSTPSLSLTVSSSSSSQFPRTVNYVFTTDAIWRSLDDVSCPPEPPYFRLSERDIRFQVDHSAFGYVSINFTITSKRLDRLSCFLALMFLISKLVDLCLRFFHLYPF